MRRIYLRSRVAVVIVGILLMAALSSFAACSAPWSSTTAQQTPSSPPGTAGIGTPTAVPVTGSFNVTFGTKYALNSCGAGTPVGALCVVTTGTGQWTNNGSGLKGVGLKRTASYAPGDGNACAPATTNGTLQFSAADRVTFTGTGTFCRATQTATFTYTITGGAGAYQNASGSGVIHVPPPSSPTDDTETWSGALLS